MLIGSYNHTADAKGRLFIPAKWRDDLGNSFVITRGMDGCLLGMSLGEWGKLSTKLASLPLTNKNAQAVNRLLSRWAMDVELDKQGRVLLSQKLREFAQIEGETTLIGLNNHIEIWNANVLDECDARQEADYDEILEQAQQEWGI